MEIPATVKIRVDGELCGAECPFSTSVFDGDSEIPLCRLFDAFRKMTTYGQTCRTDECLAVKQTAAETVFEIDHPGEPENGRTNLTAGEHDR